MSEQTQTAVDWLETQISLDMRHMSPFELVKLFEQAKEMEKQQIIDAWDNRNEDVIKSDGKKSEQYYNETYGSRHE
ncbi:hypothetical protein UFOVP449_224 [uncultured Caudovirales phage]|uniref:Uncharacterized protein n=1 Tax=uncultured Caudovirales phage TaxID=2100421 RepID=A0A6J5MEP2_9CAUD|nr:hypothetical protein UFOVP449_224 [uncultured Caudovirales phage]